MWAEGRNQEVASLTEKKSHCQDNSYQNPLMHSEPGQMLQSLTKSG